MVPVSGAGEPTPEHPYPGQQWKEVRHDKTVTWLAFWKDPISQKDFKYVWLAANSTFKSDSDLAKYEKARKLKVLTLECLPLSQEQGQTLSRGVEPLAFTAWYDAVSITTSDSLDCMVLCPCCLLLWLGPVTQCVTAQRCSILEVLLFSLFNFLLMQVS